jgi:mono/diheme cytochrome c family protein
MDAYTNPLRGKKMPKLAIALFAALITIPAAQAADAKLSKSTPELVEKGKASYTVNCATCHGDKGDGNGPAGGMMNPKPRNLMTEKFKAGDKPEQLFKTLTNGLTGTSMAPYGHLPEDERWALTHYVLSLRGPAKKK